MLQKKLEMKEELKRKMQKEELIKQFKKEMNKLDELERFIKEDIYSNCGKKPIIMIAEMES